MRDLYYIKSEEPSDAVLSGFFFFRKFAAHETVEVYIVILYRCKVLKQPPLYPDTGPFFHVRDLPYP